MKRYVKVEMAEQQLEDLVRQHSDMIEEGLAYVDHQKQAAAGRLDMLMVDSGKALVVTELKVVEDDGMLVQALDYYDYVTTIAPSFSQALVNRCKWLNLSASLFTFQCLKLEGEPEVVPIFAEQSLPAPPAVIEVRHPDDHIAYITDLNVREKVRALLDEIKGWRPGSVSLDAIRGAVSMKVNGRVFSYFHPRRKHYLLETYNDQDEWTVYPVKKDDDLARVKAIVNAAMERKVT